MELDLGGKVDPRRSTPQWPCSVYSHRHTSVITSSSGTAALSARTHSCTTPSSSHAEEPCASFSAGIPNSSTAAIPSRAASRASSTAAEIDSRAGPAAPRGRTRPPRPAEDRRTGGSSTNSGSTSCPARSSVSRTSPRSAEDARSLRIRVWGNAIVRRGYLSWEASPAPSLPPPARADLLRCPYERPPGPPCPYERPPSPIGVTVGKSDTGVAISPRAAGPRVRAPRRAPSAPAGARARPRGPARSD